MRDSVVMVLLRSLVRCGLCGEMMCPGSTTKPSSGKTHRYYRCSTRDKYGTGKCAAKPLPAATRATGTVGAASGIAS